MFIDYNSQVESKPSQNNHNGRPDPEFGENEGSYPTDGNNNPSNTVSLQANGPDTNSQIHGVINELFQNENQNNKVIITVVDANGNSQSQQISANGNNNNGNQQNRPTTIESNQQTRPTITNNNNNNQQNRPIAPSSNRPAINSGQSRPSSNNNNNNNSPTTEQPSRPNNNNQGGISFNR